MIDRLETKYTNKKSKNLHSTVAVIISHDYHKGKFETKAQILGMRPAGAAAVLTVRVEILAFNSLEVNSYLRFFSGITYTKLGLISLSNSLNF